MLLRRRGWPSAGGTRPRTSGERTSPGKWSSRAARVRPIRRGPPPCVEDKAVTDPVLRPQTIVLFYWLIVIFLAAFFLRLACGLCRAELPSWRRSLFSVVFVTLMAY